MFSNLKSKIKKVTPEWIILIYHFLLAELGSLWYKNPSKKMIVIGVTGSKGKTSTSNLIWSVLQAGGMKTGLISTANFRIGDKEIINAYHMTMPGRFELQRLMAEMVKAGCTHCVVETTSEGIKQYRHKAIAYDMAVFTNIHPLHLPSHGGSFEKYKQAKGKLFARITETKRKIINGKKVPKIILANSDDENSNYFLSFNADRKVTFGIKGEADLMAKNIREGNNHTSFNALLDRYTLHVPGKFNVYNALPAVILGYLFGLDFEKIQRGFDYLRVIPGRMEEINEGQNFRVFSDYAHEPVSMREALVTCRKLTQNKVIVVLGSEGGGRDKAKGPVMGQVAAKFADFVIVTNVDPYDDDPNEIIKSVVIGAEEGGKKEGKTLFSMEDRRVGIRKALSLAHEGDIVLITGKGAEQTMMVKGGAIPWDDRGIIREELNNLTGKKIIIPKTLEPISGVKGNQNLHSLKEVVKSILPEKLISGYHYLSAVVSSFTNGYPSNKMVIIGVTGTKGKTSTSNYIWSVLQTGGFKTGLISTANIRIGEDEYLNPYHMTMPGTFQLQKLLRQIKRAGCSHAVVETTSEGLKQHRHVGISYDVAVFTNLSPEHIKSHGGSFENYKEAKSILFRQLVSRDSKTVGGKPVATAIVANTDNEHAGFYLSFSANVKQTFGIDRPADYQATDITHSSKIITFRSNGIEYKLNNVGTFNVYNALPAIVVGEHFGVNTSEIQYGLSNLKVIPGRMELIDYGQDFKVYVDYAHEKVGTELVLNTARELLKEKGKLIFLVGIAGGGRDVGKRFEIGEIAGRIASIVIVTDGDPYDDDPNDVVEHIVSGAERAGKLRGEDLYAIRPRREAIKKALKMAEKGDILIVAGKGSDQGIVTMGVREPWDDRVVLKEEIRALFKN